MHSKLETTESRLARGKVYFKVKQSSRLKRSRWPPTTSESQVVGDQDYLALRILETELAVGVAVVKRSVERRPGTGAGGVINGTFLSISTLAYSNARVEEPKPEVARLVVGGGLPGFAIVHARCSGAK